MGRVLAKWDSLGPYVDGRRFEDRCGSLGRAAARGPVCRCPTDPLLLGLRARRPSPSPAWPTTSPDKTPPSPHHHPTTTLVRDQRAALRRPPPWPTVYGGRFITQSPLESGGFRPTNTPPLLPLLLSAGAATHRRGPSSGRAPRRRGRRPGTASHTRRSTEFILRDPSTPSTAITLIIVGKKSRG